MQGKKTILLIHPPVSKPCEPSAGIAKLAGTLKKSGIDCQVYDANLTGFLDLMHQPVSVSHRDTWSKRAFAHLDKNILALQSGPTYQTPDRYRRAVMDVNQVVRILGKTYGVDLSLSNYASPTLTPVRSEDLLQAAEDFKNNPFYLSFRRRLELLFSEKNPEIIGFSVNFMSQALCAFAMAGFIKKALAGARIVFGGGLITSWMAIPGFRHPFAGLVDDVVGGPGEDFLLEICGEGHTGKNKKSGYDYSLFDMGSYLSPGRVLPYSTSRGCYWQKCAFCPEKSEKGEYQPFSIPIVDRDLEKMVSRYHPVLVHFTDNALSPKFLKYLIKHPPKTPWYGFARITDHLAEPDFAKGLKAAGCVMLKLGVESGDQKVLDALEKGISVETVSRSLENLKAAGIATYVYLLFGTPAENQQSAEKTMTFVSAHAHAVDFLNLAIFNLPAYSDDARTLDTIEFYRGDLSLYKEFAHPQGWNRARVRRFLSKEFKRHVPIKAILNNEPPYFSSNHAPFLVMGK